MRCAAQGILLLALSAQAAVLNTDAGFETPIATDGSPADAVFLASNAWESVSSPGAPDATVLRNDGVFFGAQSLRFQADSSNSHTHALRQDLTATFAAGVDLMLSARLRANGPASAPSGNLTLSLRTLSDVVVAELQIPFSALSTAWRKHVLWPIDPSAYDAEAMRIVVWADTMGSDPDFWVDIDSVRVETVEDESAAWLPNHSFEQLNGSGGIGDSARDVLTDWTLSAGSASRVLLRGDGGSHGPNYVSAQGRTTGLLSYNAELENLQGSFLDTRHRYEVSGDARYSGSPPSNDSHLWLRLYPATGESSARNIFPRAKIRFYKLTDEFQTFILLGNTPVVYIAEEVLSGGTVLPEWNIGEDFEFRFSPNLPDDTTSYVEIDNVRLDRLSPVEAFESDTTIFVDTTRPVPNRFETDLVGSARQSSNSVYHFYLPVGLTILAAGNDPQVADSVIGDRSGNLADIYTIDPAHPEVVIEGERYERWTLDPSNVHPNATGVGPIYFASSLPAGTRARIYYETEWDAYTDPSDSSSWPAGTSARRYVNVETRNFAVLTAPQHFPSSIGWIKASEEISWPGYLDNLASFGFNAIGGHQSNDGYKLQGAAAPPPVAAFVASAKAAGYGQFANASPWNSCSGTNCTIDASNDLPIAGVVCPAYGLVDESPWSGSNQKYNDKQDELAAWIAALEPEDIQLDSEAFDAGATHALAGTCARCTAYHAAHPALTMDEALVQMQIDRTLDLRARVTALGASSLPDMGYYHTRAGSWVYEQVFDLEPMIAAGAVQMGIQPHYETAKENGTDFRTYHATAVAAGIDLIPINQPSLLQPSSFPRRTFDDTLEILGSGARGFIWWPHDDMVGADLYYFGKALESILPVEHLLTASVPETGVSVAIVGSPPVPASRYGLRASAVRTGAHYFILVSSYGESGVDNEDPFWVGDVDVTLPAAVTGRPIRISDATPVGAAVAASTTVRLAFGPGEDGARTALFHFCDSSIAACDTDGDGLSDNDELDTHSTHIYVADTDSDGLNDADEVNLYSTDPLDADSDDDGLSDGDEIAAGSDPNDPNSPAVPALPPLAVGFIAAGMLGSAVEWFRRRRGIQLGNDEKCRRR